MRLPVALTILFSSISVGDCFTSSTHHVTDGARAAGSLHVAHGSWTSAFTFQKRSKRNKKDNSADSIASRYMSYAKPAPKPLQIYEPINKVLEQETEEESTAPKESTVPKPELQHTLRATEFKELATVRTVSGTEFQPSLCSQSIDDWYNLLSELDDQREQARKHQHVYTIQ
jgi:thiamine kinase-like enzyme